MFSRIFFVILPPNYKNIQLSINKKVYSYAQYSNSYKEFADSECSCLSGVFFDGKERIRWLCAQ